MTQDLHVRFTFLARRRTATAPCPSFPRIEIEIIGPLFTYMSLLNPPFSQRLKVMHLTSAVIHQIKHGVILGAVLRSLPQELVRSLPLFGIGLC